MVSFVRLPFGKRTDNHDVEVESLANTLAVPLVWEIGKSNIAGQLPSDNVLVVIDDGPSGRGCDSHVRNIEGRR